ncbi:MAG: MerR family transcriptional regulator [Chloroflexota bacterium]|nr:MerR family transcriptional regulator [Chloroflexota bacterium]
MFTVGEFATLARVSKRLLRYYDEIGLLRPMHTDRFNGYRYYSAEQLAQLNRILVLKELGLSLDQISRLLNDDVSTDEMQGMLLLKKAEIEQQLRAELQLIRQIEARLGAIRSAENRQPLDVVIKQVPAQSALAVKHVFETFEAAVITQRQIRAALPERSGYGLCFIMCHDDELIEENMTLEMGCLIENPSHAPVVLTDQLQLIPCQIPAAPMMATTVVTGALTTIHAGYGKLGLWMEQNGYRLVGLPREITLKTAQAQMGDDLVTELQMPVSYA